MTEQDAPRARTPRPIPDLGFFGGPVQARGDSSFGAPPNAFSQRPAAGQFGGAPGASQFGSAPPAPFGPPAQVNAPGGFPQQPYAYGPPKRGGMPVWAIVAICVPVVFIGIGILAAIAIPVFLNARNTPVAPAQLGGLSASTDPQMNKAVEAISDGAKSSKGVKTEVAGYGTLTGGYVLLAFNAPVNPNQEFRDLSASDVKQMSGNVQCATSAKAKASMCIHTSVRGAVEVAAFGTVDLARLATVTEEAWAAQPFGR